jgi:hypothetical protein
MFCDGRCVPLQDSKGRFFYVSPVDLDRVLTRTWVINAQGYASTNANRLYLHHFILGPRPPGLIADHKDHDRTHNCRGNLHYVSYGYNNHNRVTAPAAVGYRGVARCGSSTRPYYASLGDKSRPGAYLGSFRTAMEAAHAYDRAARERYGPEALCNFPLVGSEVVQEVQNQFALVVGQAAP